MVNAIKHAGASKIILSIIADKEKDYFISITDNGQGFDTQITKEGHFGLLNMKKRAEDAGAKLSIHSDPTKGTNVTVMKFS